MPTCCRSRTRHGNHQVSYLFGGLAAMLGLIAFALLILSYSYWRLSGYLKNEENVTDESSSEWKAIDFAVNVHSCFVEGMVVIMAEDQKPTNLVTPIVSKAATASFENASKVTTNNDKVVDLEVVSEPVMSESKIDDRNYEVE